MNEFIKEVKEMPTADILLILKDQLDLYSEEEINILKNELISRSANATAVGAKEYEAIKEIFSIEEMEEISRQRTQQENKRKIDNLNKKGFDVDGYYEYKVISLLEERRLYKKGTGQVDINAMTKTLNELGAEGWHLVTAYTNEIGKSSVSSLGIGTNATVDEHILIFERYIRINKA